MALTSTINFDTAGNFTFDSNAVEFSGAVGQLSSTRPSDSTFFASALSSINGTWGDGTLTGTSNSSAGITAGKMVFDSSGKSIDFAGIGNADHAQILTVRFLLTTGYTGSPSATQYFFEILKANADKDNQIELVQLNNGGLNISIQDDAGVSIVNTNLGTWAPTAGVEYEIEFNIDLTAGAHRLFIDGVQHGATNTTTGTRSAAGIGLLRLGNNDTTNKVPDFSMRRVQIFDTVQHTAGYTPVEQTDGLYSITPQTVSVNSAIESDGLINFSQVSSAPSGTKVQWLLSVNTVNKYWDGAAWVTSDNSEAQSNTESEVTTNISSLDISTGSSIKYVALLISDDGVARPTITSYTMTYDFFSSSSGPTLCTLYGYITNTLSVVSGTAALIVELKESMCVGNVTVQPYKLTLEADALGYFEADIIESATDVKTYVFSLRYDTVDGNTKTITLGSGTVPNQTTANLCDIVLT